MKCSLTPRGQGDLGEMSAMQWLTERGVKVSRPVLHSPDYDLIADCEGCLLRVEVKTCGRSSVANRWPVLISTRGGNQSWSGTVKYFDPDRCDYLFVHVGDGRRWFIPAHKLECRSAVTLGGPKYSEFEIQRGGQLAIAGRLECRGPGEYRSGQPGDAVNVVAQPSQVRILPPPSPKQPDLLPKAPVTAGTTRIGVKHRVTIPSGPFVAAGLTQGDTLKVEALPSGELRLHKVATPAPLLDEEADRLR